jgi:hypothetical protein
MIVNHFPSGCCGAYKHTIRVTLASGAVVAITGAGVNPDKAKEMAMYEFEHLYGVKV